MQGTTGNIRPFELHRPASVAEARGLVAELGEAAVLMAGGVDLLQELKAGREVGHLIYLKSVPELSRIETEGDLLRLGACVTHAEIEADPAVAACNPAIAEIWRDIANPRVRLAGTIGGNLLAGNPNYDGLPALIALDAVALFEGAEGTRRVPVGELAAGGADGLMTAIEIPNAKSRAFACDRALRPVVSVAVSARKSGGKLSDVRVGVGCAFAAPVGGAMDFESGRPAAGQARAWADALPEPLDDVFASAGYRRRMIGVLLARRLDAMAGG